MSRERQREANRRYCLKHKDEERRRGRERYQKLTKEERSALYQKQKQRQIELHGTAQYYTSPKRCYGLYKTNAAKRNVDFDITLEEFSTFWQKPCYYCNEKIDTIGIDRMDNNVGYCMYNIVPCCADCNFMKRGHNAIYFIFKCHQIATHIKEVADNYLVETNSANTP